MIRTYKYIVHAGLQQEIQIIFGKPLMLPAFCEVGGGFSILKKVIFEQIQGHFFQFIRICAHKRALFSIHRKVSGINLWPEDHWSCIAHSAEDMLKSAVIEEKMFKHSPWAGADNPLRPNVFKIFMSAGRPNHYGHLLQV